MADKSEKQADDEFTSDPESSSHERANSGSNIHDKIDGESQKPKKPSKFMQLWTKTGLDVPTLMMMIKAAIPPTIATAMFQADAVAATYSTLGYLVAIVSILGFAIMPRAKFIQTMCLNVIAVCLGAAVALLSIFCAVKAREHTTPPGQPLSGYNSSASVVCAVWLFFQIYVINSMRSALPQLNFPTIIYSIFAIVAQTYAPSFLTMAQGISFAKRLIEAFFTGFALAAGVSLFIFPVTCRKVVFGEMTGYINTMRGVLKAQVAYMQALEKSDAYYRGQPKGTTSEADGQEETEGSIPVAPTQNPQAAALKAAVGGMIALHGKVQADLPFAKRETAYGKLDASALSAIYNHFRKIALPLIGLTSLIDIFERTAERRGWNEMVKPDNVEDISSSMNNRSVEEWTSLMKSLHEPFADMTRTMDEGLEHVLLTFQMTTPAKKDKNTSKSNQDLEEGESCGPGTPGFAKHLEARIQDFYENRVVTLRDWAQRKGIDVPPEAFEDATIPQKMDSHNITSRERDQRQLFVVLYMEYLLYRACKALLDLVRYADTKVEDGTMKKAKLIMPGLKRLNKWLRNVLSTEDSSGDIHMADEPCSQQVDMGSAYRSQKDPEHLPPTTIVQHFGNYVRIFPHTLRSQHSVFGFRAACAVMTLGVIAYLEATQAFFLKQRLLWSMIMVAFSMNRTSGQSAFSFVMRVFGTFVAMCASFVVWYIVDGKAAGVIVFLFLWLMACFYVVLKIPKFVMVGVLAGVTAVLIIGYELQVDKIGQALATSNGQPYYPIYELAPYRLAAVAGGIFVAYIWTIFPYPVTEQSELRRDLGHTLYLLANHYSVVHETVSARVRRRGGDEKVKGTPANKLEKARQQVFTKSQMMVQKMRTGSTFTTWQISVGGAFPKQTYDSLIECSQRILNYTALIGYASSTFSHMDDQEESQWLDDFRQMLESVATTSHEITSMLSLLSSSVSNGQPLPPYLKSPQPFLLLRKLEALDRDILSIRHISEPGYAAFAAMQIASSSIVSDLGRLIELVKSLVGELDFSFHIVSTASSSSDDLSTLSGSGKDKVT